MIRGVVFCPHPPLLVPQVAQGAAGELEQLRDACRTALRRVVKRCASIVVLGSGPAAATHQPTARGTLADYGVPIEVSLGAQPAGPVELPLALTVGAWLLRDALGPDCGAVGYSIGADPFVIDLPEQPTAVLVMGDGSARRSTEAPGYLDDRAAAFDARVADALRSGRPDRLRVDAGLGDVLLAAGPRTWNAAAALLDGSGPFEAELLYDDAPYGVGYFVAAWTSGD